MSNNITPIRSKRGRPSNQVREYRFKAKLAHLYLEHYVPKRYRSPQIFGIILKSLLDDPAV